MKWLLYLDVDESFILTDLLERMISLMKQNQELVEKIKGIWNEMKEINPTVCKKDPSFNEIIFHLHLKNVEDLYEYFLQQQWLYVVLKSKPHEHYVENRENFIYFMMGLDPKKVSWIEAMTIHYPKLKDNLI